MFHSKKIFILILLQLFVSFSWAQEDDDDAAGTTARASRRGQEYKTFTVSYTSWTEFVDLENNGVSDSTYANFFGAQLTYEKENYIGRYGTAKEASLLFGQANAGGRQNILTYQTNYRSWYGAEASYRGAYRLSPQIVMSAGPFLLARYVTWPSEGTTITVNSGSALNLGALADVKLRLTPRWEIRQMIGTMFFKASTIWSLGFGYKF